MRLEPLKTLVNGRPRGKILAKRGIRQGDPLAPFLFTIVGDALSWLIHYCNEKRSLRGFHFENLPDDLTTFSMQMTLFFFLSGRMETWRLVEGDQYLSYGSQFIP